MPQEQPSMQKYIEYIARANISRWTAQLADTEDERKRETLRQLLDGEALHLQQIMEETA